MLDNTRDQFVEDYLLSMKLCLEALSVDQVTKLIVNLENARLNRRKIFVIGNGGCAAIASHMACDFNKNTSSDIKGFEQERFQMISLTDNVSWITALANDLGYEHIFSEQLRNLCQPGDLLIAMSASGNSPNIIEALMLAKYMGVNTFGILGFSGGRAMEIADTYLFVPSYEYGFVEDIFAIVGHLVTNYFKARL